MYAGVSRINRDAERRSRLLQAALDLVGESGVAVLTVGGVCSRAALSKRYFYESFDSLDDLLSTGLQEVFDRVRNAIAEHGRDDRATPRETLTVAVAAILDGMKDPRVARLYLESAGNTALLATRDRAVDSFVDLLLERIVGPEMDNPKARMVGHLLVSGSTHVVALWLRGDLAMSRDELVDQLVSAGTLASTEIRGG